MYAKNMLLKMSIPQIIVNLTFHFLNYIEKFLFSEDLINFTFRYLIDSDI